MVYSTEEGTKILNIVTKDKKEYHVWLTGLRVSSCVMLSWPYNRCRGGVVFFLFKKKIVLKKIGVKIFLVSKVFSLLSHPVHK